MDGETAGIYPVAKAAFDGEGKDRGAMIRIQYMQISTACSPSLDSTLDQSCSLMCTADNMQIGGHLDDALLQRLSDIASERARWRHDAASQAAALKTKSAA
jgi:hypothetical protein